MRDLPKVTPLELGLSHRFQGWRLRLHSISLLRESPPRFCWGLCLILFQSRNSLVQPQRPLGPSSLVTEPLGTFSQAT